MMEEHTARHLVVIVGGAVAGSEAAFQLAQRNVICIVLEQNDHPYGKIEDGLPRWHEKLRRQEKEKIDARLSLPGVQLFSRIKLGRDVSLDELIGWGANAVILANGAWRDRALPLPGIDRFAGRGFYYQNTFVYWFNHYPEPGYQGPRIEPADGALVVGGGLASLDVVKILMLENACRRLQERGYDASLYDLERIGIAKVLAEFGQSPEAIGLRGCTLLYRRKAEDMPLAEPREGATPEQLEQTRATRIKLLRNFMAKYMFTFLERQIPVGYFSENEHIAGLRVAATALRGEEIDVIEGTAREVPAPLVVSSIGSIPEPIPGIPMRGQTYRIRDPNTGELEGLKGIYAVGNAVTGKGNILVSSRHGRTVSQHMLENYLLGTGTGYEEVFAEAAADAREKVDAVARHVAGQVALSPERIADILGRVKALQQRIK